MIVFHEYLAALSQIWAQIPATGTVLHFCSAVPHLYSDLTMHRVKDFTKYMFMFHYTLWGGWGEGGENLIENM